MQGGVETKTEKAILFLQPRGIRGGKESKLKMKFRHFLALRNMKRKPVRTAVLILLSAFLSLAVFGGSLVIFSLRRGLESYGSRLGADVIVVPYEARTKGTFESVLLQGIPGNFYMDYSLYEKINGIEGVEIAAPQFYLATAAAGCCSVSVQVIGFDPEKDFSVQPWIRESYGGRLETGDIIVGSRINIPADRKLTFYNVECNVVAQLDETGTGLDTAVYANMDTIGEMVSSAQTLGFRYFDNLKPGKTVSSVMVRAADGYDAASVAGEINIHVRKVVAEQAGSMISGIADGLRRVSGITGVMAAVIWVLSCAILAAAFAMISHERMKEFAVLRAMGASQKMLSRYLLGESFLISLAGAAAGILAAALLFFPFSSQVSRSLGLPLLRPEIGTVILFAVLTAIVTTGSASLVSFLSAGSISRRDTGLILREDT